MVANISRSSFKQIRIILEVSEPNVASVTEHPSTFVCSMIVVNTQLTWLLNLIANIAAVLSFITFLVVGFQCQAMIPQKLEVLRPQSYFSSVLYIGLFAALFIKFWVGFSPHLASCALDWPVVCVIPSMASAAFATESRRLERITTKYFLTPVAGVLNRLWTFVFSHVPSIQEQYLLSSGIL
jgi:hypothetical protein